MPKNSDYMERLKQAECRDSTYRPSTSPLVFARAKGAVIWDVEGREYIDLCAGFGALPLGHASEALLAVTKSFGEAKPIMDHAMGDVYPSEEKILFLETLKSMLPTSYKLGAVALSGGQAVEIALKTAMLKTKNTGFIVFSDAYHGLDLGVLPLTAREDFRAPFKGWLSEQNIVRLPYGAPKSAVQRAARSFGPSGLAAIVAEPIQGRAGVKPPPEGWLAMLAAVAHDHQGLLIFDEVFTGFGRIGQISTAETVDADISCFGKAIGGGFPISATFAKEDVMNAWPESPGEAIHTGTFFGHPFSAAVGRRTLMEIQRQNLALRSKELGEATRQWLEQKLAGHTKVKAIRGQGLFIGIEFTEAGYGAKLMDDLRPKGVIVLPSGPDGSVVSITPPLNIEEGTLTNALEILVASV
jgi:4-aminobutyrate aminotransferase-like enzyme